MSRESNIKSLLRSLRMLRIFSNPWILLLLGLWQVIVVVTPISLYGFHTDGLAFFTYVGWIAFLGVKGSLRPIWLNAMGPFMLGLTLAVPFVLMMSLGGMFLAGELVGTRSVPQMKKLQGLWLVNQYFMPTGAYGCGMGKLITAKALILFPLVEYRTDYNGCIHDDYGCFIDKGDWEACGY